jgi:hypothetical protein
MEEQIKDAIIWIDGLATTKEKQGKGKLGNQEEGFCCIGFGCFILGIDYDSDDINSSTFAKSVGLRVCTGQLHGMRYYNNSHLTDINDHTNAGFKRIAKFLKKYPESVFVEEVAEGIKEHYQ